MKLTCVFLVDDDSAILDSFKYVLEEEGCTVFTSTNGAELKELMSQHIPDLILMDYNLGEDNGGALTVEIKNNLKTAHIPVIIISADPKIRSDAMLMGADDFIEKPLEIPHLLSKIKDHLTHE